MEKGDSFQFCGHKNPTHIITKVDAVRNQIEASIKLLPSYRYDIAIHTLASAAKQVLRDLSKQRGGRFAREFEMRVKPEHLKTYRRYMNAAANFFKHADRDEAEEFNFNAESNDFLIFHCVRGYDEVIERPTPLMRAYVVWFMTFNPELINDDKYKALFEEEVNNLKNSGVSLDRKGKLKLLKKVIASLSL